MRTRILAGLAVLLLCIALPCPAADYFHLRDYVTNTYGTAIRGASVQVYNPNTKTNPSAYTDLAGGTAVSWPLATDSNGMFECYIARGNYDIDIVHSGHAIDITWDNYMVGSGSDTSSYSSLTVSGTVEANAFDADDWIAAGGAIGAGGPFTGQTLETSGAAVLGGSVTTGGTVEIGGDLYVLGQTKLGYDEVGNDYSINITPNWIIVRPLLMVNDDIHVYGSVHVFGKDATSGKVSAQNVECDTLKADDLYHREDDGGNEAVFHTRFLTLAPVDITGGLPDTSNYDLGTLFYATDDSFRYLAGAGIAKEWRTLAYAGYVAGADNPALGVNRNTIHFTYAEAEGDTSTQTKNIGITNTGEGILETTASEASAWIAAITDTNTTGGATWDSLAIRVLYGLDGGDNKVAEGGSYTGTVTITSDYGIEYITVYAEGDPITGEDYVVKPNHPRLYFNENEVAGIRTKCKSAELTFYTGFKDWVDDYALGDTYPFAYNYQHGQQLRRLAFAYVVEQDTTYLQEAVECADSLFAGFPTTWYDDDDVQTGYSLFYDWCYSGFGATRKSKFGDSLGVLHSRAAASVNYMTNPAHSQIVAIAPMMYMALALAVDGVDDAGASATLDSIYAHTFGAHHMGAILDSIGNDGGGFEGDYSEGTTEGVSTLFWLWDHGTDKDPWGSTNMTGWGDYLLYDHGARTEVVYWNYVTGCELQSYTLDGFGFGKQGDSEAHGSGAAARKRLVQRLAAAYQDSTLMWLSDQYDTHSSGTTNRPARWKDLVMRDTLMTATAPSATPWPAYTTAKQFDVGTVFMRSGWSLGPSSIDIWAKYRHEQYPFGHASADAGHFTVGRGHDLLLIASGEYVGAAGDHHLNYFKQTIARNTITIKDFSETFRTYENSGGQDLQGLAYTGEHPLTLGAYTDSMAGIDGRGLITDYAHQPDTLTYIKSDLTDAYSTKVDTVRREFVWMEPDNVFLVFDYAYVPAETLLQKSLFHTINNPTLNGDDTWTVVHGTSEATITFVNFASVQKIGGAGAEFEVNGTNYPIPACTDYHSDNGAYRIEGLAQRSAASRWTMAIIEVSVVGGADYGTVSSVAVGDYMGAVVNGDTLLFSKNGGAYQYRAQ